jgi:hypothetical protein
MWIKQVWTKNELSVTCVTAVLIFLQTQSKITSAAIFNTPPITRNQVATNKKSDSTKRVPSPRSSHGDNTGVKPNATRAFDETAYVSNLKHEVHLNNTEEFMLHRT